jgi:aspartyl/asparaginyl beta-hydroxylase (cupin superfamily)
MTELICSESEEWHHISGTVDTNRSAMDRLRAGDIVGASAILEAAIASGARDVSLWLNLAGARRANSDVRGALRAIEGALTEDPRSFPALLMKASLLEKLGQARMAGLGYGIAIGLAPPDERLDPPTLRALAHARDFHAQYQSELRRTLLNAVSGAQGLGGPGSRRIDAFIDHLTGRRKVYGQEPTSFFFPGLPAIEFYEGECFPWLAEVEGLTGVIRSELRALMSDGSQAERFVPYVSYQDGVPLDQWTELNRSPRWSAYYLYRNGEPVAEAEQRCPETISAIRLSDPPNVIHRSPAAMFSVLKPRTRIPPHTGVSNTRLVVHLPLLVPDGCGFRVGNETRFWQEGTAWVFDDTIEHEAWNVGDEPRTILIFDVWSPFLTAEERELVAQVTETMDAFNGAAPGGDL